MRLSDEQLGARVREILGSSVNNAAKFAAICEVSLGEAPGQGPGKEPDGHPPLSSQPDPPAGTFPPPPPPNRKKSTRKKTSRRR